MSTGMLFGFGAFITFITLWGVVMAGGVFATRHQAPDDEPIRDDGAPLIRSITPDVDDGSILDPAPVLRRTPVADA